VGGEAGAEEGGSGGLGGTGGQGGGSAGLDAHAGAAGSPDDAGSSGMAGDASVDLELEIVKPALATGKTYLPFTSKISAKGATHYDWSLTGGALPAGLTLQGTDSATVTIAGTPTEAGQFPLGLSVTDGVTTKAVDVTLAITHAALFLSDRNTAGVNELYLAEIGTESAATPVRLSASIPSGGGVTSYAWSPDGSKVLYLATQSSGGAAELWVASLASPGIAQRVSAQGVAVSQMTWLQSGNIAAYTTSGSETSLVDLSGSAPGDSKVVIPASTSLPRRLAPSPNGNAVAVLSATSDMNYVRQIAYVTWNGGMPKSVPFGEAMTYDQYSYDGRFVVTSSSGIGSWADLSLPSLTQLSLAHDFRGFWSHNAPVLLYSGGPLDSSDLGLFRVVFNGGSPISAALVPPGTCKSVGVYSWSPDGKNASFGCDRDLRGINSVATASVGSDFSLLPSGFLSNSFSSVTPAAWSPNSTWLGLSVDRDVDNQNDLYLVRWSAPGTAYKAHSNSVAQGVSTYAFSPNSKSIAFVGMISPQANNALYLTKLPTTGAPPLATLISAPASAIVQSDLTWLPGSRVLTYRASVSGATQLFAVPVAPDGSAGTPVSISGVSGSGVPSYQLAPTR